MPACQPSVVNGMVTRNAVTSSGVLLAVMFPPCSRATSRAMAKPSPNPPASPLRALSAR